MWILLGPLWLPKEEGTHVVPDETAGERGTAARRSGRGPVPGRARRGLRVDVAVRTAREARR